MFFDDMNMNIMSVYNMKLNNNYNQNYQQITK